AELPFSPSRLVADFPAEPPRLSASLLPSRSTRRGCSEPREKRAEALWLFQDIPLLPCPCLLAGRAARGPAIPEAAFPPPPASPQSERAPFPHRQKAGRPAPAKVSA